MNKVINDALFYGIQILYKKYFGAEELTEDDEPEAEQAQGYDLELYTIMKLLKELVLNSTISKSILSSLFNAKSFEYRGLKIDSQTFLQGLMSDTPDYLVGFENDGLRKLRG